MEVEERRKKLLGSLGFRLMDSREATIKKADAETCRWFLDHPDYKAWCDSTLLTKHRGLLWIRGKPGAGKSTMAKFILSQLRRENPADSVVASFFFNARGARLEHSVSGMYRALLLQLLQGFPDLQNVFDDPELLHPNRSSCSFLEVKDLFYGAVGRLERRSLTCIVDALDESDEQHIMDMVEHFETISEHAARHKIPFRVLFSSRHYPYIDIRVGIRVTLERQAGHTQDLEAYVRTHLRIADAVLFESLLQRVLEKASGVFLWVHLVVGLLNKEARRGGLAVKKKLAEVPPDLKGLFLSILARDSEDKDALFLSILWILFAVRPLTPAEYCHALWSGLRLKGVVDDELPNTSDSEAENSIRGLVVSYSKGLAEITWLEWPRTDESFDARRVQFIHESVRDFLIKEKGIHEIGFDLGFDWESIGQDRLKQCCDLYTQQRVVRGYVTDIGELETDTFLDLSRVCPFLAYANENVLYHSDRAAETISQATFLNRYDLRQYIRIDRIYHSDAYEPETSLIYVLSDRGLTNLIWTWPHKDHHSQKSPSRHGYPLFAALSNEHREAAAALLGSSGDLGIDPIMRGKRDSQTPGFGELSPLLWFISEGLPAIVRILLRQGAPVNLRARNGTTALGMAFYKNSVEMASLLIDHGADVNQTVDLQAGNRTPLVVAIDQGLKSMAKLLIEAGGEAKGCPYLLVSAARMGDLGSTKLLIEHGAIINTGTNHPPLFHALLNRDTDMTKLLVENGADVHFLGAGDYTPITLATLQNCVSLARLFLRRGADVNAPDGHGFTPLGIASMAQKGLGPSLGTGTAFFWMHDNPPDENSRTPLDTRLPIANITSHIDAQGTKSFESGSLAPFNEHLRPHDLMLKSTPARASSGEQRRLLGNTAISSSSYHFPTTPSTEESPSDFTERIPAITGVTPSLTYRVPSISTEESQGTEGSQRRKVLLGPEDLREREKDYHKLPRRPRAKAAEGSSNQQNYLQADCSAADVSSKLESMSSSDDYTESFTRQSEDERVKDTEKQSMIELLRSHGAKAN